MHGYHLLEKFRSKDQLGRIWTMSTSQLYAVLRRLEEKGAIAGEEMSVPNAPSKIVYSVTPEGIKVLEEWLYDENPPSSIHLIRVIFISRLYIASLLGYDIGSIVDRQKKVCQAQLEMFSLEKKGQMSGVERLTVEFVIGQLNAAISWLEQCVNPKELIDCN